MNTSSTVILKSTQQVAIGAALVLLCGGVSEASAAPLPSVVSAPVGAAVQGAGGAVSAVGQGHAGIAPTVYNTAPALEPAADGVTNALLTAGGGLKTSGQNIQTGGLAVSPVAGASTAVQTVRNGTLVQVRAGSLSIGRGSPTTVVGVGALSSAPPQGTLATAGVANANALLNANVAPQ